MNYAKLKIVQIRIKVIQKKLSGATGVEKHKHDNNMNEWNLSCVSTVPKFGVCKLKGSI